MRRRARQAIGTRSVSCCTRRSPVACRTPGTRSRSCSTSSPRHRRRHRGCATMSTLRSTPSRCACSSRTRASARRVRTCCASCSARRRARYRAGAARRPGSCWSAATASSACWMLRCRLHSTPRRSSSSRDCPGSASPRSSAGSSIACAISGCTRTTDAASSSSRYRSRAWTVRSTCCATISADSAMTRHSGWPPLPSVRS